MKHGTNKYIAEMLDNGIKQEGMLGEAMYKRAQMMQDSLKALHDEDEEVYGPIRAAAAKLTEGYIDEEGNDQQIEGADQLLAEYQKVMTQYHGADRREAALQWFHKYLAGANRTSSRGEYAKEQRGYMQAQDIADTRATNKATKVPAAQAKATEESYGAIQSAEGMAESVRAVRDQFEGYSKESLGGTGPIMGRTKNALGLENTVQMESAFSSINIQNLRETAQGMSKLFDTKVERQAWEATQPKVKNNDRTNRQILIGMEGVHMKHARYKQEELEHRQTNNGSVVGFTPTKTSVLVSPDGQMELVERGQVAAARKKGMMTLDEYSDKGPAEAGDTVSMVAPDGRKLKVPKSKVEELKAKGAKVAQ